MFLYPIHKFCKDTITMASTNTHQSQLLLWFDALNWIGLFNYLSKIAHFLRKYLVQKSGSQKQKYFFLALIIPTKKQGNKLWKPKSKFQPCRNLFIGHIALILDIRISIFYNGQGYKSNSKINFSNFQISEWSLCHSKHWLAVLLVLR